MDNGNWFKRHLNWTLIISLVIFFILTFVGGFVLGLILGTIDPFISDDTLEGYSYVISFIISLTVVVPVALWILDRKGRSLWNVLWLYFLSIIGLIIFLALENKRQLLPKVNRIRGRGVVISLAATTSAIMCLGVIGAIISFMYIGIFEPAYDTPVEEIMHNPIYWNTDWEGSDYELQMTVQAVSAEYCQTHTYIEGETDCNDMVVDIWNMLYTEGITSIIVVGNQGMDAEYFEDCDHAWLLICDSMGNSFALEATEGLLIFAEDADNDPSLDQYWEGYFYTKPSDLREDSYLRW